MPPPLLRLIPGASGTSLRRPRLPALLFTFLSFQGFHFPLSVLIRPVQASKGMQCLIPEMSRLKNAHALAKIRVHG